ncbi:MAG: class I SAM-dependent methyltransferase [Xanthomonadales bacterium]|jgi:SAM-dependent methyltransferase|nr:class I SAM-dependent methyltransferase [Xanthomonadales bacterium]
MRLDVVERLRNAKFTQLQALYPAPVRPLDFVPPQQYTKSPARIAKGLIGRCVLPILLQRTAAGYPACRLPGVTHLSLGYRFSSGYPERQLRRRLPSVRGRHILIPGCNHNSAEVREWLQTDAASVAMLDIVDNSQNFERVKPDLRRHYRPQLEFLHGSLESVPLADQSVDLIYSRAVLEHVGNLQSAAGEMARVLKPGGYCLHDFGPLYFTFGGDHTIPSYGFDHGYDHLLLDEDSYQARIRDDAYYAKLGTLTDHSRYWALQGIFSYLKPAEYLAIFQRHFEIPFCLARLSPEAIAFRQRQPTAWQDLLDAGLSEPDLLISDISLILRRPTTGVAAACNRAPYRGSSSIA